MTTINYIVRQIIVITVICFAFTLKVLAQQPVTFSSKDIFQTAYFIENHGQFDAYKDGLNDVKYGVQNAGDYFYFNKAGFVYHIYKVNKTDEGKDNDAENSNNVIEGNLTMRWINTSPNVIIEAETKSSHYFSYGSAQYYSPGYKKITYHNLYPGVDVEYIIPAKGGIKYSLIIKSGADLSKVRFTYSGMNAKPVLKNNNLLVKNDIIDVAEQGMNAKFENGIPSSCHFTLDKGVVGFSSSDAINSTLIIDPWVKSISTLNNGTDMAANKGFDVDFDYNGNYYVYGGGTGSSDPLVAKYSPTGTLLWTFAGSITGSVPPWDTKGGCCASNFIVDKSTDKVYIGQGYTPTGTRIARLNTSGIWDTFMTAIKPDFNEIWEMNFDCRTGNVLGLGGGTSTNINMGAIDKLTDSFAPVNITGVTGGFQDILNSTFDPNGNLYVIFASGSHITVNNHIYRVNPTYTGFIWDTATGYNTYLENNNKPYIGGSSNGHNCLAANSKYLFYYDGFHLKAFSVTNGAPMKKTDSIAGYKVKWQGGIVADECGHVYVGGDSGNIKVFTFDTAHGFISKPDIIIPGMFGRHIHDMRFSSGTGLIYITGDSLAATIAPSYSCIDSNIKFSARNLCSYYVAKILNNDTVATYTFEWKDSASGLTIRTISKHKHNTDTLLHTSGSVYYLTITKNALCGGSSVHVRFQGGALMTSVTDSFCPGKNYYFGTDTLNIPGTYTQNFKSKGGCDSNVTLHLGRWPIPFSNMDMTIALGDSFTFNSKNYSTKGTYIDTLQTPNGCDSLAILNLIVKGGDVYVPSAFSPNHDGHNDRLFPIPIRHAVVDKFCIYDRWGELIYESHGDGNEGSTHGWNGTYRGQPMPIATYAYFVTFRTIDGNLHTKKGVTSLVR